MVRLQVRVQAVCHNTLPTGRLTQYLSTGENVELGAKAAQGLSARNRLPASSPDISHY
jgi:hypothetical protein